MARDIEEFLRQAAERRKQQKQSNQPPASDRPQSSPPVEQYANRQSEDVCEAEVVEPTIIEDDLRSGSVGSHVQSHLAAGRVSEHAEHLSDSIRHSSERVDRQVHRHLDHELGQIKKGETITDDQLAQSMGDDVSPDAIQLIQMLSTPQTVRQAILVAEVLRRPSFDD